MERISREARKVETRYTLVQGIYSLAYCAIEVFAAVYLSARGVNDGMIRYMHAFSGITSIGLQLCASALIDRNQRIGVKRVVAVSLCACYLTIVLLLKAQTFLWIMLLYALLYGVVLACHILLDSVLLEYVNVGIPTDYGKPRSLGSFCYAVSAGMFGTLISVHPDSTPVLLFLIFSALTLISLGWMPHITRAPSVRRDIHLKGYWHMLRSNPALRLFLAAVLFSSIGQCGMGTYLIRIIERAGGNASLLGITVLIESGTEVPMFWLSKRILKKYSCSKLLLISFASYVMKLLVMAFAQSTIIVLLGVSLSFLCYGIFGFAAVYLANDIAGEHEKVKAQALLSLCRCGGLGGILGNLMNGALIDRIGLSGVLAINFLFGIGSVAWMAQCHRKMKKD